MFQLPVQIHSLRLRFWSLWEAPRHSPFLARGDGCAEQLEPSLSLGVGRGVSGARRLSRCGTTALPPGPAAARSCCALKPAEPPTWQRDLLNH